MFYLATITNWESLIDSRGRVPAKERVSGRQFLINPNRITDLNVRGTGSKFLFFDNDEDYRENASYVESTATVTELMGAYDGGLSSQILPLTVYKKNDPNRDTYVLDIKARDFAYADAYNPDPTKSWVVYIRNGFKRVMILCTYSLAEISALVENEDDEELPDNALKNEEGEGIQNEDGSYILTQ
jgi:hypothetical protein